MDPDGRVQPREPVNARERPLGRRDVPARDEDPFEASQARTADDLVGVGLEPVGVEVAVAVDEPGQARVSW